MSKHLWPSFSSTHLIGTNFSSYKMSLERQRALANVIFYHTWEWFLKRFWSQLSGEVSGLKISWFLKILGYFLFFRLCTSATVISTHLKSIFEEILKSAFRNSFRIENILIFKDFRYNSYFSVSVRQWLSSPQIQN